MPTCIESVLDVKQVEQPHMRYLASAVEGKRQVQRDLLGVGCAAVRSEPSISPWRAERLSRDRLTRPISSKPRPAALGFGDERAGQAPVAASVAWPPALAGADGGPDQQRPTGHTLAVPGAARRPQPDRNPAGRRWTARPRAAKRWAAALGAIAFNLQV